MTLIKSISGIRGTIGGKPDEGLTPLDVVKFSSAYGQWIVQRKGKKVVIGRDARVSGKNVSQLVASTLTMMGLDVVDVGLSTTPTVEMAVLYEQADGGIICTASHNPMEWNALKLLNEKGEFISAQEGEQIVHAANENKFVYASVEKLGRYEKKKKYLEKHIADICKHPLVKSKAIKKMNWRVVVDGINSSGAVAVPLLLKKLGVKNIHVLNEKPNGKFAHNPEPLPEHLKQISSYIKKKKCDVGIVVDPDVDRLMFMMENGESFGEEYTLVAVADYVLEARKGNTVSNLSSSRALRDVTENKGGEYFAAAVGEVNVVKKMKEVKAVIGGEGNGGIIVPDLHYGRDALMGIALFLSHAAIQKKKLTKLKATYPAYFMAKEKITLSGKSDSVFSKIKKLTEKEKTDLTDGVKILLDDEKAWVHLRPSNTEPIIRLYVEATSPERATELAQIWKAKIEK